MACGGASTGARAGKGVLLEERAGAFLDRGACIGGAFAHTAGSHPRRRCRLRFHFY